MAMSSTTITQSARYLLPAVGCILFSAHARAEWVARTVDGIMGTRIVVELWHDDKAAGEKAIDAVIAEMERIDRDMSTYKPDSEVSRVNAQAAKGAMKISPELFELLTTSLEYSRLTD